LICGSLLVNATIGRIGQRKKDVSGEGIPSLPQAATRVTKQANMPTVRKDSLILLVVVCQNHTADVFLIWEFFDASEMLLIDKVQDGLA